MNRSAMRGVITAIERKYQIAFVAGISASERLFIYVAVCLEAGSGDERAIPAVDRWV
jgi:hypothetical protein